MVALSMNQGGGQKGKKANQNLLKVVRPKLLGGMPKGRVKIPSLRPSHEDCSLECHGG